MSSLPENFGSRLRATRVAEGLSLSEFARRLYYSKGHVSRIETGSQSPSPEFVRKCDAELRAGGELIALAGEKVQGSRAAVSESAEEEVWAMTMMPDGGVAFSPLARRDVLLGGIAMIAGLTVHDGRRTCATLLVDLDIHPRQIMQILRHAEFSVTMEIYAKASSKATKDALKAAGGKPRRLRSVAVLRCCTTAKGPVRRSRTGPLTCCGG
jgi:transcriptional regulator with XRE-family HTH domain